MNNIKHLDVLTKEFLTKELTNKTVSQISKETNINRDTVYYWVRKFKIKINIIKEDLTNRKFGLVTVIGYESNKRTKTGKAACWKCLCNCGTIIYVDRKQLFKTINLNCGCQEKLYTGKYAPTFTGFEGVSGSHFSKIMSSAKKRQLEFDITKEYIWNLFLKQNQCCAISGIELSLTGNDRSSPHARTASLDRIDSSKGYIQGNVQWVHRRINTMKNNMSDEELINWCQTIIEFQNSKKVST